MKMFCKWNYIWNVNGTIFIGAVWIKRLMIITKQSDKWNFGIVEKIKIIAENNNYILWNFQCNSSFSFCF